MEYLVLAEIEIDGTRIEHFTNITLRQKFNAHHEFIIRINQDVLETSRSFSMDNAKKQIGKPALIRLHQIALSLEVACEFRGIISEVRLEQSGVSNADLVLVGYSPTILIENGQNFASFYDADLKKIVEKITKPLGQVNCNVNINTQYTKQVKYICQYKESGFHFINRLSGEFSEFFFYDGKDLNFGKPGSPKEIEITYGEDIISMQMTLQARPMNFSNYSYISKEDKVEKFDAPAKVDGLGQYASYVLKESNNLFSDPVNLPIRQRIAKKSDLENFVKNQKAAMAADLEVLTGSSYNPGICIGGIINVKISRLEGLSFVKEDYGKFLVTGIEHHVNHNGKYYNEFEAVPSGVTVLPLPNLVMPLAESQIAIVKDNKDPDNMGRVRIQMLWQQGNDMTDWLRVLTPDGGGPKNRGYVFIPEIGDQVLIGFRYNDPDRPYVVGSMFNGKTGGGGGDKNKSKIINTRSGVAISIDDDKGSINVADAKGNSINFDGNGNVSINGSATIQLLCGGSSISMKKDGTIGISGKNITVMGENITSLGSKECMLQSGAASVTTKSAGNKARVDGLDVTVNGSNSATLSGNSKASLTATGMAVIEGAVVKLN